MEKRVLVVDDDESTRFVLSRALERMGCRVAIAEDGAEVPALMEGQQFDLLVVDLYMPGMNGFELLRQVRRGRAGLLPAARAPDSVRILVVSGESYPASATHVKTLGADAYLTKPVDLDVFELTVHGLLGLPFQAADRRLT